MKSMLFKPLYSNEFIIFSNLLLLVFHSLFLKNLSFLENGLLRRPSHEMSQFIF